MATGRLGVATVRSEAWLAVSAGIEVQIAGVRKGVKDTRNWGCTRRIHDHPIGAHRHTDPGTDQLWRG